MEWYPTREEAEARLAEFDEGDFDLLLVRSAYRPGWEITGETMNEYYGGKPLESFLPSLAALPSVQTALTEKFGKDASAIIAKLKADAALSDEELGAYDIIYNLVGNDAIVADSLHGWSSAYDDIFPINIMQFGSVFWVAASEFDDIGYFDTLKHAKGVVESVYYELIAEVSKHEHKG